MCFSELNMYFVVPLLVISPTQSKFTVRSMHVHSYFVKKIVTRVMCVHIDARRMCHVIRALIV
jgi:hypothetical protein